ncbi:MAG: Uma2 family endonuclease [Fuerstiella sp.]|nr:Uma2 family endonuclease [Fuerstiella sp.]MCP4859028.1 Uma2 family endonuclease [Fuerstiella sp.]
MASEAIRYTPNHSADEYRRWEGDWELWEGVPVCMSPSPTARHQLVSLNLAAALRDAIEGNVRCDCLVVYETDWQIGDSTVIRPDISVLCNGLPNQFIDYPPSVIVEVLSSSTAEKDRTVKRQLYEGQGVAVYLLVDPDSGIIEALQLADGKYLPLDADDRTLTISWNDDCRATIKTSEVFAE